ncbi:MAG: protease modulator HflC [Clostridiales bacterium]|nr:protease modulator HflC [Clostridiales bacterium]
MKAKLISFTLIIVLVVIGIIVFFSSAYTVKENEFAFVIRFSKIIDTVSTPGLHFKVPFLDTAVKYSNAIQVYNIPTSDVINKDKENMIIDSYVLWRIGNPLTFYKTLGTTAEAERRLDAVTYNALKNYIGTLHQKEIIKEDDPLKRNSLCQTIADDVTEKALEYGIDIIDVKIKRIDLPKDNEQAVFSRMISERNQMADKYTAEGSKTATVIRNEVDKEVDIIISNAKAEAARIEAEGESEYMRLLAEAYNTVDRQEFYEFMIALDALKSSLVGENKTIILGPDSPLAKILTNK